ncbi:hypothetical protein NDU88_006319 [Pleurodeles waltl]|uniref:Uncharacterized protein n=1 Tax=Pleurodeles waltl TaxID=8319 RepID=A0AAV7NRG3_PLEWA|nr:hypothetical protein NDU88_006319 [Pleurodeles waltl]
MSTMHLGGALPDLKGKGRSQSAITNFLTSGVQEYDIDNPIPLPKDMPFCLREDPEVITHREEPLQAKDGPSSSNFLHDTLQDGEGWRPDEPRSCKEQMASTEVCTRVPTNDSTQMQTAEYKQGTQDIQGIADKPLESRLGKGEGLTLPGNDAIKDSELEASKSGRGGKITDWSRARGDKFYSLTEDSEAIISGCNQSEAEGSISSESESVSSVVGPNNNDTAGV